MEQMREPQFFAGQMPATGNGPANPFYPMGPQMPMANTVPPGLNALYAACRAVYPDQQNPLQVAAVVKYWLGGPDPLDYISMFANPGDPEHNIPPHWHYVSFGLSDLHGDGRVHMVNGNPTSSGFGFELTFRLKRDLDEASPPTWPAAVMQSLAKYVFQSENTLCPGDHVSWHCSLDNSDSRIQHMLMTEDAQLGTVPTPFGSVTFIQIVGVCIEELQAAQQWNGPGLIDLMKSVPGVGGSWLITDMRRGETIFEIDPEIQEAVDDGIAAEGSNLSGVTAKCSWTEKRSADESSGNELNSESEGASLPTTTPIVSTGHQDVDDNRNTLSPTSRSKAASRSSRHSAMSVNREDAHDQATQPISRMSCVSGAPELIQTKFLTAVHIQMNLEAGILLPLAFKGRLKHGRHFTFKTVAGDLAITLLTEAVSGAYASLENPFALHGPWLQVLIPAESVDEIIEQFQELSDSQNLVLPKLYEWPDKNLSITLVSDDAA